MLLYTDKWTSPHKKIAICAILVLRASPTLSGIRTPGKSLARSSARVHVLEAGPLLTFGHGGYFVCVLGFVLLLEDGK